MTTKTYVQKVQDLYKLKTKNKKDKKTYFDYLKDAQISEEEKKIAKQRFKNRYHYAD
jgi:hypothetical protein